MRLLLMADLHGSLPELPKEGWDLLIIAGDICPDFARGSDTPFKQAIWLNTTFKKWLPENALFTWGNHDQGPALNPEWIDEKVMSQARVDSLSEHEGVKIWWSPWSNAFGWTMAFMKEPHDIAPHYDLIPEGVDIIVSHAPPYWYRDQVHPDYHEHLGSKELLKAIHRVCPKMVVCGHIHGGYGVEKIVGGPEVFNVARMTEQYQPKNKWMIVEV